MIPVNSTIEVAPLADTPAQTWTYIECICFGLETSLTGWSALWKITFRWASNCTVDLSVRITSSMTRSLHGGHPFRAPMLNILFSLLSSTISWQYLAFLQTHPSFSPICLMVLKDTSTEWRFLCISLWTVYCSFEYGSTCGTCVVSLFNFCCRQ